VLARCLQRALVVAREGLQPGTVELGCETVRTGVAELGERNHPVLDDQVGDLVGALVDDQPLDRPEVGAVGGQHVLADPERLHRRRSRGGGGWSDEPPF